MIPPWTNRYKKTWLIILGISPSECGLYEKCNFSCLMEVYFTFLLCHILFYFQKIRTIELDGKTIKLQIVSNAYCNYRIILIGPCHKHFIVHKKVDCVYAMWNVDQVLAKQITNFIEQNLNSNIYYVKISCWMLLS
jgi:hypothetical protein